MFPVGQHQELQGSLAALFRSLIHLHFCFVLIWQQGGAFLFLPTGALLELLGFMNCSSPVPNIEE